MSRTAPLLRHAVFCVLEARHVAFRSYIEIGPRGHRERGRASVDRSVAPRRLPVVYDRNEPCVAFRGERYKSLSLSRASDRYYLARCENKPASLPPTFGRRESFRVVASRVQSRNDRKRGRTRFLGANDRALGSRFSRLINITASPGPTSRIIGSTSKRRRRERVALSVSIRSRESRFSILGILRRRSRG